MKLQSERQSVLAAIKQPLHTAAWFYLAGCIAAIPYAGAGRHFRLPHALTGLVLIECAIVALNRSRCPLTDLAGRSTDAHRQLRHRSAALVGPASQDDLWDALRRWGVTCARAVAFVLEVRRIVKPQSAIETTAETAPIANSELPENMELSYLPSIPPFGTRHPARYGSSLVRKACHTAPVNSDGAS